MTESSCHFLGQSWCCDINGNRLKMTESSCHFPGQSWLRKVNSDSADEIKSWRIRRWLEACIFEGEADLWMDTRVMVHRKQRVPMKIWAQRDIWYFLVETKWKGLHFTPAGGSLTAFGGQLPRPLQGAAKPRRKKSPGVLGGSWEWAAVRKEYSRIYTATSHISWSNFRYRKLNILG